jgi:hypothetical protein
MEDTQIIKNIIIYIDIGAVQYYNVMFHCTWYRYRYTAVLLLGNNFIMRDRRRNNNNLSSSSFLFLSSFYIILI